MIAARTWLGMGYLSLVATALAFVVWFRGIARLPVVAPPLLGLAAPATGAVLGWVILGQSLSPTQLAGFAVTLGAIAYAAVVPSGSLPRRRMGCARGHGSIEPVAAVNVVPGLRVPFRGGL